MKAFILITAFFVLPNFLSVDAFGWVFGALCLIMLLISWSAKVKAMDAESAQLGVAGHAGFHGSAVRPAERAPAHSQVPTIVRTVPIFVGSMGPKLGGSSSVFSIYPGFEAHDTLGDPGT